MPLLHSHGVEKPVVGVVPVDAVISLCGDPFRRNHFLQKDPLEVLVLLHVFLDHLVDVVRRLAGHQVLWRVESRMIRFPSTGKSTSLPKLVEETKNKRYISFRVV